MGVGGMVNGCYGSKLSDWVMVRWWVRRRSGKIVRKVGILGMVRFPRNLIIGVRSACAAAAACRKALVANIL